MSYVTIVLTLALVAWLAVAARGGGNGRTDP